MEWARIGKMGPLAYRDATLPTQTRIEDLLARMTLAEKVGQMTQVEKDSIEVRDIARLGIGSLLNGGGGSPGTINITIDGSSTTSITQASTAALSSDNNSALVTGDTPGFNGTCSNPTLPANP